MYENQQNTQETIKELRRQIASLQAQLDAARATIEHLKQKGGLLRSPNEDLYPGEQLDFLLSILEQLKGRCLQESRPYEIIEGILSSNKKVGEGEKIEKAVWKIIGKSSKLGDREVSQLNDLGFKYVSSKRHPKLKFCDKYLFVFPSSTGDKQHALKNLASEISNCIATSFKF